MQPQPTRPMCLAAQPMRALGELIVEPASRSLRHKDGRVRVVEPRVMQVLVVLLEARGRVVGRDELMARCWAGRVVGDDAVNRVVSVLRRVGQELGEAALHVQTVARVGYRLPAAEPALNEPDPTGTAEPPAPCPAAAPELHVQVTRHPSRRLLLRGSLGLAIGAAAVAQLVRSDATDPDDLRPIRDLLRMGLPEAALDAAALLEVRQARHGHDAAGWGLLALAHAMRRSPGTELPADPPERAARLAAASALAQDKDQPDARLALVLLEPVFRAIKRAMALAQAQVLAFPEHAASWSHRAMLLTEVGRWAEAEVDLGRALAFDPGRPGDLTRRGVTAWAMGNGSKAESLWLQVLERWPRHAYARDHLLLYRTVQGNVDGLDKLVAAWDGPGFEDRCLPLSLAQIAARALNTNSSAARAQVVEQVLQAREMGSVASTSAAMLLMALGQPEAAASTLRTYYEGGGWSTRKQPPPVYGQFRTTAILHMPLLKPLRERPEFAMVIAGLDRA